MVRTPLVLRHGRRRVPHRLLAASCAFVVAAGTALLGSTAEAAAPPPPDPLQAALQRDLGLTAEQVVALQASEDLATRLDDTFRGRFAGAFGGTWIDENTNQVIVGITDSALAEHVAAEGAVPQQVAYPGVELDLAAADLDHAAEPAPDTVSGWYVDVAVNRLVVETLPGTADQAWAYLSRNLVRGTGIATVEETDEQVDAFADMHGGDEYHSGGGGCSIGFPVTAGGFLTAGHCGRAGTRTSGLVAGDTGVVADASYPGDDYGWVRAGASWQPTPFVNGYPGNLPVLGAGEASRGSSVCRSGFTSGFECGRIKGKNKSVKYGSDRVGGLTKTNICSGHGDSGGSMLSNHQAQGTVSGGSAHCNFFSHNTYFQPVSEPLRQYGLALAVQRLCSGMTWSVSAKEWGRDVTKLASDVHTNPYNGDTPCDRSLPVTCLLRNGQPLPPGLDPSPGGWTGGSVALTSPVRGATLSSRAAADALCASQFGPGWRMGEFHDGSGGWSWWANGDPQRMWVSISDQPANPWNTGTGQAMTWTLASHQWNADIVDVVSDARTNPYSGDTPTSASLPVLCLRRDGRGVPPSVTPSYENGWAQGEVRLTGPVPGTALTSRFRADVLCMSQFGLGWRMAEFHDGGGGWGYWAAGDIGRTWVAIDDQNANPWNR
jgi:hypothetical protein